MKKFILFIGIFISFSAKASDTLTRAQVYNFSVGDTFDYKYIGATYYTDSLGAQISTSSTTYARYIIANISYSLDSSTKYIQRLRVSPLPASLETDTLLRLPGFEVFLDTCSGCAYYYISTGPTSQYNGRSADTLNEFVGSPGTEELVFVDGLGCVLYTLSEGGCGPCQGGSFYSTILIYYAKGTETWGIPYYNIPTETRQINASTNKIVLFPTLNDGTFEIKIDDAAMLPINLLVYNLIGQELENRSLNNLNNEVSLGAHSAGVYIWKAVSGNQVIQTGKMVVH